MLKTDYYSVSDYCNQTKFQVPDQDIHNHLLDINSKEKSGNDPQEDISRVQDALFVHAEIRDIDTNTLDEKTLEGLAKRANAAFIHFTYNCSILANAMLYNLESGKEVLCAKNVYPPFKGFHIGFIEKNLFKVDIGTWRRPSSLKNAQDMILADHERTQKKFYMLNLQFNTFWGEEGHFLNAVVLNDQDGKARVVYVDAWTTSQSIWTLEELEKEYHPFDIYIIKIFEPLPTVTETIQANQGTPPSLVLPKGKARL
ncbi:MAG: T3SS effector cysteine hydrolase SpvD family protein [Chlamydiia bacterium]|nr:T3SS effector cysteine hydrolase SpvD family protein [Chlamydiia bacterium]